MQNKTLGVVGARPYDYSGPDTEPDKTQVQAMAFPWEQWVPGVLNKRQMQELLDGGFVTSGGSAPKLDHSSMDVSLANEAYIMQKGAVKPLQTPYEWFITQKLKIAERLTPLTDDSYELKRRKTYVFRLQEKLEAKLRNGGVIYGQATAKSSVGRVDVLARLIVDGMQTYECFDPEGLKRSSGAMFLEITPITFDVKVKPGTSLSQLRFFYGKPDDVVIKGKELFKTIFRDAEHRDESLTVDLSEATIGDPMGSNRKGVAFRSKLQEGLVVPLWPIGNKPQPSDYWEIESADESKRLYITPDVFYILRSKERLTVPKGVAIYCRATDETIGEMRIHYAGFVHPYFGLYREDGDKGTPVIFEVRGHEIPVSLADQEKMANLIFYRMSEDCPTLTEEEEKAEAKGYGSQELKLSKFFADWVFEAAKGE